MEDRAAQMGEQRLPTTPQPFIEDRKSIEKSRGMLIRMTAPPLVTLALLAGCAATVPAGTGTTSHTAIESSRVDPKTGNLIAWWMTRREGTPKGELVPVLVTHPYAIFIQWRSEEYYPDSADKRVFLFYDNVAKKSYQTRSFDAFVDVVGKQPGDVTLLQLDTCTVSRDNMPKELRDQLERVLAEGNRKWAVNPADGARIIRVCYCESDWDFVFPGDGR